VLPIRKIPIPENTLYTTRNFSKYNVDGVKFDLIAGFSIIANGKENYFPLDALKNYSIVDMRGSSIHLDYLESWRKYYQLMGKTRKVKLIDDVLEKQSIEGT